MSTDLFANELIKAAKLIEREEVPASTQIHFFRPGPMVVIAEWLVDAPDEPTGKMWRRVDVMTGKDVNLETTPKNGLR